MKHPLFKFLIRIGIFLAAGAALRAVYHFLPEVKDYFLNSWALDVMYKSLMIPVSLLLSVVGIHHDLSYSETSLQYFIRLHETGNMLFLWVPCLGLSLIFVFVALVVSFPGSMKLKLIYSAIGILLIEFLNILRLFGLSTILSNFRPGSQTHSQINSWLVISHEEIFNYTIIAFILLFFVFITNRLIKTHTI